MQNSAVVFHVLRVNPLRGGRQQPHESLSKFEKYNGGRKRHLMVALSLPKIFNFHVLGRYLITIKVQFLC
jgi:hypothetical protein